MRKVLIAVLAAALAVTGVSVFAVADEGRQGTSWTFTFSARTAATATGSNSIIEPAKIDDKGTPDESDDRYVAPSASTIKFPKGSGIDTGVLPVCKASPSEVQTGEKSCPSNTRIGSGLANSVVGQSPTSKGTEIVAPIDAFNRKNEILFFVQPCAPGSGPGKGKPCQKLDPVVLLGKWSKVTTQPTLRVPTPPALLQGGVTITRFQLKTSKKTKKVTRTINGRKRIVVRSYATTPGTCPKSKVWKSTAIEQYQDGSGHTIPDSQPCRAS